MILSTCYMIGALRPVSRSLFTPHHGVGKVASILAEESLDLLCNLHEMRLQCKMTSVQQNHLRLGNIFLERLGAWWDKELIVLTPNCEEGRLPLSEVCLPLRVRRDVIPIVIENIELDVDDAWARHECSIERPS